MEQPTTNENEDNTKYPIDPSSPIVNKNKNSIAQEEQNSNQANETGSVQSKTEKVVVVVDKEKSIQPVIANIIAFLSVIVSAILFYYTYLLFKSTKRATDAAVKSANISDSVLKEQRKMDSLSIVNQKKSSYDDSVNISKRFKLDSTSMQEQVKSFKESKKEFEIENQPYLQILNPNIDAIKIGEPFVWKFFIKNIGNSVIKEKFSAQKFSLITLKSYNGFKENPFKFIGNFKLKKNEQYIGKDIPSYQDGFSKKEEAITNNEFNEIVKGRMFVFMSGRIIYTNTTNGKDRKYTYVIEFTPTQNPKAPFPAKEFDFIYNKNEDVKK